MTMEPEKANRFSLKDQLFSADKVRFLASRFSEAVPEFDLAGFTRAVLKRLSQLELKQRIVLISEVLERYLPDDFPSAAEQILRALPAELDPTKTDDDFGDFIFAPLGEYVVRRGLTKSHVSISLSTLKEITKRFSMEDAMRAFINAFPDKTLRELEKWSGDKNYHVRRLVSECTRPRLPWSRRLKIDHGVPLPLLDRLHADTTRYVTRSVANHLNDIAKVDPTTVLTTLARWRDLGKQDVGELQWISRHALRTLVKQGHAETLKFLGYKLAPQIEVNNFQLVKSSISPGEALEFSITLTALRDESLIVDYVIDFVKANGRLSPKAFKAKTLSLQSGQTVRISKRHLLRADATTYRLFPGMHRLTVQVNGTSVAECEFEIS